MLSKKPSTIVFAECKRASNELPVVNGLAYDVKDVAEMVKMGRPISSVNSSQDYYDGDTNNNDYSVPMERRRGYNLNQAFQDAQRSEQIITKSRLHNLSMK